MLEAVDGEHGRDRGLVGDSLGNVGVLNGGDADTRTNIGIQERCRGSPDESSKVEQHAFDKGDNFGGPRANTKVERDELEVEDQLSNDGVEGKIK